ncbi:hypothetical protein L226DRAFT_506817 [Lentinus tigrinus ALCF2SS1-7]|uniref:F-box domain-containing protein n=1 Tax=Lentinus tigrinus ALCF2SS1-6 TaxID=1328759 RepID=A0A5C2SDE4_9APHY|nr:hypothetical protein L227DRAFT_545903 [Lentinus tigrinus ALCF2SS1-6]RPD76039.1 hypothetical protein L226DRAFT_506817 [Lentinus tigrinus ALCF2SS1-7]
MVSADNLNLDCLELIFAYLSGNDLVHVSLVSRSFLTAVVPRLYRTLSFGLQQAKRYPSIISPFAAVLAHTHLAKHVRHIDLRAIPTVKFLPQPKFMDDCMRTLSLCKNLGSFTCTLDVMPSFLLCLQDKQALQQLRIIANFTSDQVTQVTKISGLNALTLDSASWNVVDALPRWSATLGPTLTSLTLTSVQTLSLEILDVVLPKLPKLNSLHVINCPKIDQSVILQLLVHTPALQSLAFTSYEHSSRSTPAVIAPLPLLRHLAIDTQCAPTPGNSAPTLWTTTINLTKMWSSPLKSLSLKLSDKVTLGDPFVKNLVEAHHATLTHLSLRNCLLSKESTTLICKKCTELETLKLTLSVKDMYTFADSLEHAKRVHTITDLGDLHSSHTQRAPIPKNDIRMLMTTQPSLEKVVADGRTWMAIRFPGRSIFDLEVKKNGPALRHWFMPPAGVVQTT